ncbi:hypothetical protein [Streptacidiphilus rugosus]|uniref:hypothetical protein n=1 Tax=Streptacidiphilus rugosus TaxID=405783 RepID=UPI00055DE56E|nr:hypothetical protein [Streptacidiphilus rugosus]
MRVEIGGERFDITDDLARVLAGALRGAPVAPPTATDFDELVELVADLQRLNARLSTVKEIALARADTSGPYANRRTLSTAAGIAPSQLSRVLEGHGLPTDRRGGGVDLVIAFRTADDGILHLAAEDDIVALPSFPLPPTPPATAPGLAHGTGNGFTGRELECYYRPRVPVSAAALGRSAGFTLRCDSADLTACMAEPVFDALHGDPRVDPTRPNAR